MKKEIEEMAKQIEEKMIKQIDEGKEEIKKRIGEEMKKKSDKKNEGNGNFLLNNKNIIKTLPKYMMHNNHL